jgi:hypothetical protein
MASLFTQSALWAVERVQAVARRAAPNVRIVCILCPRSSDKTVGRSKRANTELLQSLTRQQICPEWRDRNLDRVQKANPVADCFSIQSSAARK